jgi:hypothetical protein
MSIIKTAHKQYPKAILKHLKDQLMQATLTDHPLYALAWADKKLKLLINTRGATFLVEPSI